MTKAIIVLTFLFIILPDNAIAQNWQQLDIPFSKNGVALVNPLAGGFNKPQFSAIDLNFDGIDDLFVFDKDGDVISTFINNGTSGQTDFHFAPTYTNCFPHMIDWVMLRDFNSDGIADIFTNSDYTDENGSRVFGIKVFKGLNDDGLQYEQLVFPDAEYDLIQYQAGAGTTANLEAISVDYPAIDDFDDDGDLDILTFGLDGGVLFYYKNIAMESGFGPDSLIYVLEDDCWGGIYESNDTNCPLLAAAPGDCAGPGFFQNEQAMHVGSTILSLDLDGDDDKDVLIGDSSLPGLVQLSNNGTTDAPWVNQLDCNFPSYDVPADITIFPCPYWLDVDNDGLKDLLASPYNGGLIENYEVVWWWKNTSSNAAPVFEFQQTDFMVDQMLDHGFGSNPCFYDYNEDGLLDLIVGNFTFFNPAGGFDTRLFLYLNTGTATAPAFELADEDFLGLNVFTSNSISSFAPAAGDPDSDGDMDLVLGTNGGALIYFENTAGAGNIAVFAAPDFSWFGIDPGIKTTPRFVDLNRDSLLDLVVGEANGTLSYFSNTGTAAVPVFEPDESLPPNNNILGLVNTALPSAVTGGTAPLFFDNDGAYILFCGTQKRGLVRYDNIDDNLAGAFDWTTDFRLGGFHEGDYIVADAADINANGLLDFVVGNNRGGIRILESDVPVPGFVSGQTKINGGVDFNVFPNPADDIIYFYSKKGTSVNGNVTVYDMRGKHIVYKALGGAQMHMNLSQLQSGVYIVEFTSGNGRKVTKLLVY